MDVSTTELLLKKPVFEDVTNAELVAQIEAKKKCKTKLPTWYNCNNCYYPNKLNIEQTSSETAASYKASIISGKHIIDITGGLGVDSYYFSKKFEQVIHCEINTNLSSIVKHNFTQLGCKHICCINDDGIAVLDSYKKHYFDAIYIDPSRRHDVKGKVFLLKDCLPDITVHLDSFLEVTNTILLKVSPLLDIRNTLRDLRFVSEVHIVAIKNEVKELLFLIEKTKTEANPTIKAINLDGANESSFSFRLNETYEVHYENPKYYLYEPNNAILKSGGFNAVAKVYGLGKLAQHSHLYTSNELIEFPGRSFEILDVVKFNKKVLKKQYGGSQVNITTRNFPKTVSVLRKELQLKDGGNDYWFFTTLSDNQKVVVFCRKINHKTI